MIYTDERKQEKREAKVGDFIFAGGELRVIWEGLDSGKTVFKAIYVTGCEPFCGAGSVDTSIEEMIEFYKGNYEDFELIKADEMELVRRA